MSECSQPLKEQRSKALSDEADNNESVIAEEDVEPDIYCVKQGDTLAGVAIKHGMKISELKYMNHLLGSNIFEGQVLCVRPCHRGGRKQRRNTLSALPTVTPFVANDFLQKNTIKIASPLRKHSDIGENYLESSSQDPASPRSNGKEDNPRIRFRSKSACAEPIRSFFEPTQPRLLNSTAAEILSDPLYSTKLIPMIEGNLPRQYQGYDWRLLYSLPQHGANLGTFLRMVYKECPTVIVIETSTGEVFGGVACSPWRRQRSYYGTGECFLFTTWNGCEVFSWKWANSMFMYSTESFLAMGGGGHFGWMLNQDMSRGSSGISETFGNRCLASQSDFDVVSVEAWGLVAKR